MGGYMIDYVSFMAGTLFGIIFFFACVGLLHIRPE